MNQHDNRKYLLFTLASLLSISAAGQAYIGFVYPAGGQQGTTFRVTLGGQSLQGVDSVWFPARASARG